MPGGIIFTTIQKFEEGTGTGTVIPPAHSVSHILSIRLFTSPVIVEEFWFWLVAIVLILCYWTTKIGNSYENSCPL